jgi:hypothetical protein
VGNVSDQGLANPGPQTRTISGDTVVDWSLPPLPPSLALQSVPPGQFQITLTGQLNREYVIEITPSLASPLWVPALTNTAYSGMLIYQDSPPAGTPRFYRARMLP